MRYSSGFTLVEMLIVVAVMAVIVSISGVFLNRSVQQQRLNEAATVLSESLRQAANKAMTESRFIDVEVKGDKVTWLASSDSSAIKTVLIPNKALVSPVKTIKLTGRGLPETAQVFTASLNGKTKTISLLPTGVVMIR